MIRTGVFIAVILLFLFPPACGAAENFQEGFGGIPWGTAVDRLEEMQQVGSNQRVDYYVDPDKQFVFDEVTIDEVVYGFFEKRFFAAYLNIETLEVFQQLKRRIQARYGPPLIRYAVEGQPSVYRWKKDSLKIKLKIDSARRAMKLALYYVPLTDKVNEDSQERYQERGLRFLPIEPDRTPEMIPLLEF